MFQAKSGKCPVVGCCRGSKALRISDLLPDRGSEFAVVGVGLGTANSRADRFGSIDHSPSFFWRRHSGWLYCKLW